MKPKQYSEQFLRHRKFLMVLPMLSLPFVIMIFWSLGGGSGNDAGASELSGLKGLNMQLPDASFKEDASLNKMGFYDMAASDSVKQSKLMENDPSFQAAQGSGNAIPKDLLDLDTLTSAGNFSGASRYGIARRDPNEEKVYQKLAELNSAMMKGSKPLPGRGNYAADPSGYATSSISTTDVDRLENMMHTMNSTGDGQDPEMEQLSTMLEKISDIQHPELVKEKIRQSSLEHHRKVYPVIVNGDRLNVSLLSSASSQATGNDALTDTSNHPKQSGFYSQGNSATIDHDQNTVEAVVHESQSLVSGASVKLRLISDVYIQGVLIPKGNFIFGTASLEGERLIVTISAVRYQNSIFPVRLTAYDLDGMEGIFVPGAIARDVAKSSGSQLVQGIGGMATLDASLAAQAASAGIEAAKSLLTRKARLIRVTVQAGIKVLLKDSGESD